jgi:hypothetical protein
MKRGNNFARVKAGLEASRDGAIEERARLNGINQVIMGLPEAVRPMAQRLMFSTRMSAEEIAAAARCAAGGQGPSMGDARLASLGRSEAARLLGKVEDPNISFDPVAPNIRTFDADDDLVKAGSTMATALKAGGYLSPLVGLGRMA